MAEKQAAAARGAGGGGSGAGGPAPFLVKTHQMVEDAATDQVISWNEEGSGFVVWKPVEFARDLLPAHFKHNNFSSFVRQLNTYGFRKVVPDRWEFVNDHFRRGEQRLLQEIRRRKASNAAQHALPSRLRGHNATAPGAAGAPSSDEDRSSSSTSSLSPHGHRQLAEENEKLRKDNQALSSELAIARQHCEELLAFLSRYVDLEKLEPAGPIRTFGSAGRAAAKAAAGAGGGVEDQKDGKGEGGESLKLFGVWLSKRSRCEEGCDGAGGRHKKRAAMRGFRLLRWAEAISSSPLQGAGSV